MSLISILYGKTRVVINDSQSANTTGFKGALARVKRNVLQEIGMYGGIVLDCCLSEEHSYKADVTQNPIEDGEPVADHINLKPVTLKIDGLVSDTPLGFALIGTIQNVARQFSELFGTQSRSKDAFDALVELRNNRTPFTVITNLKRYDNMVISDLNIPYTSDTGYALDVKIEMQQVNIVKSKILNSTPVLSAAPLVKGQANLGNQVSDTTPAGSSVQAEADTEDSFLSRIF